jgi:SMODS and SLOG-associating 2TM effector domain 3/SMODS and SLOG-associating 2TM effector domain 1
MQQSEYPALYQSSTDLSQDSQTAFFRAFFGHMFLLCVAAIISISNSSNPYIAILQAMILLGALGCAIYLYWQRPDRHWYSGRAVTESIKTVTWRYISKAEPFNGEDEIDKDSFLKRLKSIVEQNRDVGGRLKTHLEGQQISGEMARLRNQSFVERVEYYRIARITDQLTWYAKKAATNSRNVDKFFGSLVLVLVLAILCAIARVKHPTTEYWPTDFLVTLAAAVLSWIQAKRFQELAISYALTAHEINMIREQLGRVVTDEQFSKFVGDAENAFSREHTQWVARRDQ